MEKNVRLELMKLLAADKDIPPEYKYILFPTLNHEYELSYAGKMRKEDILAGKDGVFSVPIQLSQSYVSNVDDTWSNMIVFGDNLQFLKTIYENRDPYIKDKVKGRVKLIYIDPPFGTGDVYDGNNGQNAYSAKKKGTEFLEFLRRRLLLAQEILAPDGVICVRIDYHFGHYVKVVMDEVFDKSHFINEIVVNRVNKKGFAARKAFRPKKFPVALDSLFFYSKSDVYYFDPFVEATDPKDQKEKWHSMEAMDATPNILKPRIILGEERLAPSGSKWKFSQETIDRMEANGEIKLNANGRPVYKIKNQDYKLLDTNWSDIPGYSFSTGYPTENSEQVLRRVIMSTTQPGDLVMDFFGGSGTTMAVAEKLGRRWITCDLGKLSYYTMQRRILTIADSKSLGVSNCKYGKKANNFIACQLGMYDLNSVMDMDFDQYRDFVADLFEIDLKPFCLGGISFDGYRERQPVIIWNYQKYDDIMIDEDYLRNMHAHISNHMDGRVYFVAPANSFAFVEDYYEIAHIRYYFLEIPYQIIRELHKIPFHKIKQPTSKNGVNNMDEAVGFHFRKQPTVRSQFVVDERDLVLKIDEFRSYYYRDEDGKILNNFETLSAIYIDYNYDGEFFCFDQVKFFDELEQNDDGQLEIVLSDQNVGEKIMLIYVDIYGNDFKEIYTVGGEMDG